MRVPEGSRVSPGSRSLHYKRFLYRTCASSNIRRAGWNVGQLGPERVFFPPLVMLRLTNLRVHLQCWEIIARVCSGNSSEYTLLFFFPFYLFRLPSAMKSHQSVNNNQINKLLLNVFSIYKPSCRLLEIVYCGWSSRLLELTIDCWWKIILLITFFCCSWKSIYY